VADLLDPARGFLLLAGFASPLEIAHYRRECERAFDACPRHPRYPGYGRGRLNRDFAPDYVLARPGAPETRLYRFLENPHSPETRALDARALAFRDGVEARWLGDPGYRRLRAAQRDYVQVSRHLAGQGIGRHRDSVVPTPRPLLQCVVLLSEPGVDFADGEFVLQPRTGSAVRCQADLGMRAGDALIFDKWLEHAVEPAGRTRSGAAARWSVVIGGRFGRPAAPWRAARRLSQWARQSLRQPA
jgi:hypothetical protein